MIRTIVYISNAVKLFEERHLDELFCQSVNNNSTRNITGILLYNEGTFIQILEGHKQPLDNLFKTIHQDRRHNNITKILDRRIGDRLFSKYRTGFSTLNNYSQLEEKELPPLSFIDRSLVKNFIEASVIHIFLDTFVFNFMIDCIL